MLIFCKDKTLPLHIFSNVFKTKNPAISCGACVIANLFIHLFNSVTRPAKSIVTIRTKPFNQFNM